MKIKDVLSNEQLGFIDDCCRIYGRSKASVCAEIMGIANTLVNSVKGEDLGVVVRYAIDAKCFRSIRENSNSLYRMVVEDAEERKRYALSEIIEKLIKELKKEA